MQSSLGAVAEWLSSYSIGTLVYVVKDVQLVGWYNPIREAFASLMIVPPRTVITRAEGSGLQISLPILDMLNVWLVFVNKNGGGPCIFSAEMSNDFQIYETYALGMQNGGGKMLSLAQKTGTRPSRRAVD